MKLIHKATITVFSKEGENEEEIKKALISLVPFNLEQEKIQVQQKTALGFQEKKIRIFKIEIEKKRHTNLFLKHLLNRLTEEQKSLFLRQKESRLDENLHFFIRFDKKQLIEKNKLQITERGECFHIELSIAAFPSKRENALEIIEKIFKVE